MVNILILDDDPARHRIFARALKGHKVRHAQHADDFAKEILRERADVVYLDHDLAYKVRHPTKVVDVRGHDHFVNGNDAAQFIAALFQNRRPTRVIIHSMNRHGASNIAETLEKAGVPYTVAPFNELFRNL